MKPVKIAVIGAGSPNIATSNHLPAIDRLKNMELSALCDISDGVREFAKKYNVKWTKSLDDILADDSIDAVDICTPDWLHAEQIIQAAKAGKHILCEKPIALSFEEVENISQVVESSGVTFMAAHMKRFHPLTQKIKTLIESDELGKIVYARISVKGAFFPYPAGSRYYKKETRGQFVHNGPHYVDTLCFLLGDPAPKRVYGKTLRYYPNSDEKMETGNFTTAEIRFENGTIGSVEQNLTLLNPRGYPTNEVFQIIGTKASLMWSSREDAIMFSYVGGNTALMDPLPKDDSFEAELSHFADCVQTGKTPISGLSASRKSICVCLAALDSAEQCQPINLL